MLQYKNRNSFKNRVKFDKPILRKNSNDFDDSDVDSNFSFEESSDSGIEIENGQTKMRAKSTNNKIIMLNKPIFSFKEEESNNSEITKTSNKKHFFPYIDKMYSDKEDSDKENDINRKKNNNNEKNNEKDDKRNIEKELILSITNKEIITRERLHMAETIKFKNEPDKIIFTDEYGFLKNDDKFKSSIIKQEKNSFKRIIASKSAKDLLQINARIEKWNYMLQHYKEFSTKKRDILKSRTRKGIPDSLRAYAWQLFADKEKYYIPDLYKNLEKEPVKEELERTILKDLDRTLPLCQFFREKYGNGQRKLYKVLSSYSKYNSDVGYVQGMGFIAAIFLTYMDEESSFFMLHSLMKKYKMEGTFFSNFPDLRKKFFIFLNLQKKFIPKIYNIFQRDGILPTMYASTWFISLFARSIDFHIVLRIFDCFFLEGFKVIYRISLALLKLKENEFCRGDKGCSLALLQTVLVNVNVEKLFKLAFGFSISRNYIDKCEVEYEKVQNDNKNEFIAQLFF